MGSNVELDIGADISDERHCKNQEVRNSTNCGLKKTRQRKKISPYSSNVSGIQHCTNATGEPLDQDRLKSSKDYQHVLLDVAATCTKNEPESAVTVTAVSGVTLSEETEKSPRLMVSCTSSQGERERVKETPGTLPLLSMHVRWEREDVSLKPVEGVGLGSVDCVVGGNQDENVNQLKKIEDQHYCHIESRDAAAPSSLDSLTDKTELGKTQVSMNQSEQSVCSQTSYKNAEEDTTGVCLQAYLSASLPLFYVTVVKDPQYEDISDTEDLSNMDMNLLNTKQRDPSNEDVSEENPEVDNNDEELPSPSCEVSEASITQSGGVQSQAKIPKNQTLGIAQHCSCPCFVETEDGFERLLCPKCDSEKHLNWQASCSLSPLSDAQDQEETDEDDDWLVMPISVLDVKWEPADEGQADPETVSQHDGEDEDQVKQSDTNPAVCEVPRSVPNHVPASAFSMMEVFDTPSHLAKVIQSRETMQQSFMVPSSWGTTETKAHRPQNRESHSDPDDSCETEDSSDYSSDSGRNYLTVSKQLLNNLSVPASAEKNDSDSEKENEDHEMTNLQQSQTGDRSKPSEKDDIINLDSDTEDEGVQSCPETKTKRLFSVCIENSGAASLNQLKKPSPETVDGQCRTVKGNCQTNGLKSTLSRCCNEVIQSGNSDLSQRTEKCNNTGSHHGIKAQNISDDPAVIVISDTEDDGNQINRHFKRKSGLLSESMGRDGTSHDEKRKNNKTQDGKHESARRKTKEPGMFPADTKSQHQSKLQHPQLKEKKQDVNFRPSHSIKKRKLIKVIRDPKHFHQKANRPATSKTVETDMEKVLTKSKTTSLEMEDINSTFIEAQTKIFANENSQINLSSKDSSEKFLKSVAREAYSTKACHEHVQQKAKRQLTSKTMENVVEKCVNKQKKRTIVLSSLTEGSNDALLHGQTSPSSKYMPKRYPQTVDLSPNPVSPHFVQKSSQPCERLKHMEHSTVQKNETLVAPETSKNTRSSKKETQHFYKEINDKTGYRGKHHTDAHHTLLSKTNNSSASPRQHFSLYSLQQSHSNSSTSTLSQSYTHTKDPSSSTSMQQSAKKQVFNDCQKRFVPTRRAQKSSLESNLRTQNSFKSLKKGRSGDDVAPKQRHSSCQSVPPLMKRTKCEAIQLTKARNRDTARKQRFLVSEGCKWKNETSFMANRR
ncbi:serine-rich adhesin for platelets-like [Oreochromis aureus]|uniref:serine-rich adhesin for platelets-like n=1 Tax=Oreochromis aureus TaxID=47969 RepID=UPI001954E554|nr:serine-rich adhesin for platelets-like [Oreochromis aureus]